MLSVGSEGLYEWLVSDQQFDLLRLCPRETLRLLRRKQRMAGGVVGIAYSPQIRSVEEIPSAGWDEWYIFDRPADLGISHLAENIFEVPHESGHVSIFVNYGFALHPPERAETIASLFWPQINRIRPESYVADNNYLTFVSANKDLFSNVLDAIKALG